VPLVVRTPAGGGRCYGATHSQSLEAWFLHVPGLKVVAPATPADAKSLLTAAIRDDNPVLCVEHKLLYATTGPVPESDAPATIGRAAVRRAGTDVTLVTYSYYVGIALTAAEELASAGIDAEVVDLRSLVPMDTETVLASVRKTGRLVCIEEGTRTGGVGAEIAARVAEHATSTSTPRFAVSPRPTCRSRSARRSNRRICRHRPHRAHGARARAGRVTVMRPVSCRFSMPT